MSVKSTFIDRAQNIFVAARNSGVIDLKCCCERSLSEPDHHLWIRSFDDTIMRDRKLSVNKPGYFDVSLVPLLKHWVKNTADKAVLRIWTEDYGSGINSKLYQLFPSGMNACGRKGLKCEYLTPHAMNPNAPHGLIDFYRPANTDWIHMTDADIATIVEDYRAIERAITNAKMW